MIIRFSLIHLQLCYHFSDTFTPLSLQVAVVASSSPLPRPTRNRIKKVRKELNDEIEQYIEISVNSLLD